MIYVCGHPELETVGLHAAHPGVRVLAEGELHRVLRYGSNNNEDNNNTINVNSIETSNNDNNNNNNSNHTTNNVIMSSARRALRKALCARKILHWRWIRLAMSENMPLRILFKTHNGEHMYVCMYVCMYACMHAYVYVYVHVYVYLYLCIYVYIYIYIHTYTHIVSLYKCLVSFCNNMPSENMPLRILMY